MPRHGQRGLRERAQRISTAYPILVRLRLDPGCGVTLHEVRLWMSDTFRNPVDCYMDGHVMVYGLSDGGPARHLSETWACLLDRRDELRPGDPHAGPSAIDANPPRRSS